MQTWVVALEIQSEDKDKVVRILQRHNSLVENTRISRYKRMPSVSFLHAEFNRKQEAIKAAEELRAIRPFAYKTYAYEVTSGEIAFA